VPDGTAVTFTAEGASIVGSCLTVGGLCSVTFTSQALRPVTGRVTVLAYAVGEEGFTDLNGNGWFDLSPTNELIDSNRQSTDIGEAFVDFNENGVRDANEPFIDFNNNGVFDGPDGKYSGVLCDETVAGRSSAGSCAASKTLHVRRGSVVVLSGSTPVDTLYTTSPAAGGGIQIDVCKDGVLFAKGPVFFRIDLTDKQFNALPAGTTIALATTNGVLTSSPLTFVVPSTTACVKGTQYCPASAPQLIVPDLTVSGNGVGSFFGSIESDATQDKTTLKCTNERSFGTLTATVKTPLGKVTTIVYGVYD
jgi:hypothetical protein